MNLFPSKPDVKRTFSSKFAPAAAFTLAALVAAMPLRAENQAEASAKTKEKSAPANAGSSKKGKEAAGEKDTKDNGKERNQNADDQKVSDQDKTPSAVSARDGKKVPPAKEASNKKSPPAKADPQDGDDEDSDDSADSKNAAGDGAPTPLLPEGDAAPPFTPSREEANRNKLNALLPTGSTHRGVYYPSFRAVLPDPEVNDPLTGGPLGVDAPLDSLFKSDTVTRLDDDHVQFDNAHWVQFDQTPAADGSPKPTMKLDIERGVYDLKTQILMTNQPVRIENQQLIIVGDSMLHDRVSGLTRLTGRVRMTVFQEEPSPAAAPGKPEPTAPQQDQKPSTVQAAAPAPVPPSAKPAPSAAKPEKKPVKGAKQGAKPVKTATAPAARR